MTVFSHCLPTVPPTEDPVPTCNVYIVIMAVVTSVLISAVVILRVVTGVLYMCCRKGKTGACPVCSSGYPAADVMSQVLPQTIRNSEEMGCCGVDKNRLTIATVQSNLSSSSFTSIHSSPQTHSPLSPGTPDTNSGSGGSSSSSTLAPVHSPRPRKLSRKRSEIAGEQGEVLLSEGDDDPFHDQ